MALKREFSIRDIPPILTVPCCRLRKMGIGEEYIIPSKSGYCLDLSEIFVQ